MYRDEPDFVRRMDAFFTSYKMYDDPIKELKAFWDEHRKQVIGVYRDSDRWINFYNIVADVIDEYNPE